MSRLFPCIPIFRRGIKKSKKKMRLHDTIKIELLPTKSVFINVKKGMSEFGGLIHPNTYY